MATSAATPNEVSNKITSFHKINCYICFTVKKPEEVWRTFCFNCREQMAARLVEQRQLTVTLLLIVVFFIVSVIPTVSLFSA